MRRTLNPISLWESDSARLIYFSRRFYRLSSFPSAKKQNLHLNVTPPPLSYSICVYLSERQPQVNSSCVPFFQARRRRTTNLCFFSTFLCLRAQGYTAMQQWDSVVAFLCVSTSLLKEKPDKRQRSVALISWLQFTRSLINLYTWGRST